jgi:hypothetical protein
MSSKIRLDRREPRKHSAQLLLTTLACTLLLQACGGGPATVETGASESPSTPTTPTPANHAPSISGTAPSSVQAGQSYSFKPAATDADGDRLMFSIANKPSWATFDASTGQLTGTAIVGQFAGVAISVSDGIATASLPAFVIDVTAAPAAVTGSATVSWLPPTGRTDGTALTNLASYHIWYGTAPGSYTQSISVPNPGVTSHQIDNLAAGTYYFVVTAVDASGYESEYSVAASKTIG